MARMTTAEHVETCVVDLPSGPVPIPLRWTRVRSSPATVILAPGAGAGADHPFLRSAAEVLASYGLSTVRFDFAYRAQGRRMPGPAAHAVLAWKTVFDRVHGDDAGAPVVAMGKSYGGRMASMAAAAGDIRAHALIYLGYPLHPPGRPDRERVAHLTEVSTPQLFLSGRRDPFVAPTERLEEIVAALPGAAVEWIDDAGHSFELPRDRRTSHEVAAEALSRAREFLRPILLSPRDTPGGRV